MISDTEDNSFNKSNIKKVSNNPGIYKIINTINNKCYIGKSMHLRRRLLEHLSLYKKDTNKVLYKAINKYGLQYFSYKILFEDKDIDEEHLFSLEEHFIKKYGSYKHGYNVTTGGEGVSGRVFTEEEKEKCRQRYLNNSALKQQAENCKKQTFAYNISTKKRFVFNSEQEAANYLISLGYKSSKSQVNKVITGKTSKHHNFIFSISLEDLNNKINNLDYKQPKIKIDYYKFYNQVTDLSDAFGVLPTIDKLVNILNMPHTSISRRLQYLKSENKLVTINILDTKRYVIKEKIKDFKIFDAYCKITYLKDSTYKILTDIEAANLLNYKQSSIKTFRRNNKVIKNMVQLSTYVPYLQYIQNKRDINIIKENETNIHQNNDVL